jgi:hypothetical protein
LIDVHVEFGGGISFEDKNVVHFDEGGYWHMIQDLHSLASSWFNVMLPACGQDSAAAASNQVAPMLSQVTRNLSGLIGMMLAAALETAA